MLFAICTSEWTLYYVNIMTNFDPKIKFLYIFFKYPQNGLLKMQLTLSEDALDTKVWKKTIRTLFVTPFNSEDNYISR